MLKGQTSFSFPESRNNCGYSLFGSLSDTGLAFFGSSYVIFMVKGAKEQGEDV